MNTFTANSASYSDVAAAVAQASDGDVVRIPAGTASWTQSLQVSKAITIEGAGIGQTVLFDDVVVQGNNGATEAVICLNTKAGAESRLTGVSVRTGQTKTTVQYHGSLQVRGNGNTFRIDHCEVSQTFNKHVGIFGAPVGVIDHCNFYSSNNIAPPNNPEAIYIQHDTWGGGLNSYGDGSWAAPLGLGSQFSAVYIEDCVFHHIAATRNLAAVDCASGARWVFRNNQCINTHLVCHGTESGGRLRSGRSYEVYNNTFTDSTGQSAGFEIRGGTGVIFSNVLTGYNIFGRYVCNRTTNSFPAWGGADGANPLDLNDPLGVFASGVYAGPAASKTLFVSGAGWTVNQWTAYTVRNLTKKQFGIVTSNTSDTISFAPVKADANYTPPAMTFDPGDQWEIRRVIATLDMIGRSTGSLLSGNPPQPQAWCGEALDPLYVWNNTHNGAPDAPQFSWPIIQPGRDVILSAKPGYVPLVYPHPLVASGGTPPAVPGQPPGPPSPPPPPGNPGQGNFFFPRFKPSANT